MDTLCRWGVMVLLIIASLVSGASAGALVAVKEGDWIEYNVMVTGNPTPIHNITWARLDVKKAADPIVYTDIRTMLANGTLWLEPDTNFNVASGAVGEGAIIPINLTVGDVYFSEYEGNITITGTEMVELLGIQRAVLTGEAENTSFMWDKETGVMVEATTVLSDCVVYSEVKATNLWGASVSGGDALPLYLLAACVIVLLAVVLGFVLLIVRRKNRR